MKLLGLALATALITTVGAPIFLMHSAEAQPVTSTAAARHHGAPGPVAGAGLPILAVGYGVYWIVKRRKKSRGSDQHV